MAGLFNAAEGRRPAFFEMYAQERLIPMLRPAVKHVIAVFAERNVRLLPIHNNADDIITLGLCVLEGHYLRKHAATFAENFYGLQRTSAFGRVGMTLTLWQRICALMWTVLLPAAKEKLDRSYTNQVEAANASGWQNTNQVPGNNTQLATNSTWASIQSRLLPLFVQWYPVAHLSPALHVRAQSLFLALSTCTRPGGTATLTARHAAKQPQLITGAAAVEDSK